MGSLVQNREELERRVDDLRAFEREYCSRLKSYVEEHDTDHTLPSGPSPTTPSATAQTMIGSAHTGH